MILEMFKTVHENKRNRKKQREREKEKKEKCSTANVKYTENNSTK